MSTGKINVHPIISHRLALREGPDVFKKIINKEMEYAKILFYPELD
jgi:L-iditol 2-dehydrogenase